MSGKLLRVLRVGIALVLLCGGMAVPSWGQPEIADDGVFRTIADLKDQDPKVRLKAARALTWAPHATGALIEALADEDATVRDAAARSLGWKGNRTAVEPLAKLMADPVPAVRVGAVIALARISNPAVVDILLSGLQDKESAVRVNVVRQLGSIAQLANWVALPAGPLADNDPELRRARDQVKWNTVIDTLAGLLTDEDVTVRVTAATTLILFRDDRARTVVFDTMKSGDARVRRGMIRQINRVQNAPQVLPGLVKFYCELLQTEPDASIRQEIIGGLGVFADRAAVDPLIALLGENESRYHLQAIMALGQLRDAKAMKPLLPFLANRNPRIQAEAAIALGLLKAGEAYTPLIGLLKDPNVKVRRSAIVALGVLGDARAVDPLIAEMAQMPADVRAATVNTLKTLTGQAIGDDAAQWQQWLATQKK